MNADTCVIAHDGVVVLTGSDGRPVIDESDYITLLAKHNAQKADAGKCREALLQIRWRDNLTADWARATADQALLPTILEEECPEHPSEKRKYCGECGGDKSA